MTSTAFLPPDSYDVVVIGAGPSGLTTATSLARAGASVLLVEKHPGLSQFPKATGLRPRTMEIIRSWGLEPAVLGASQPAQLSMSITPMLTVPGTEVSLGLPTDAQLAEVSPSRIAVCPQDRFEAVLLEHLLDRGGEVSFATTFRSLTEIEDGVQILLRTQHGDKQVRARYVVAADGARSAVREHVGIPFTELGSEGHHLSAVFHADLSSVMPERPHVLTATVAPGREGLFVAAGGSNRWIYDLEWHPENGETMADWPVERVVARIRAAAGLANLDVRISGLFPWDFGAAVADRQREGRVFLVGDAAHRTTPRGATGMNTGVADGHNLGWKLAWVVRGWAAPELLDSYVEERAGVGRANAEASLATRIGAGSDDALAHDFDVRYASSVITGTGPLVGSRAPHAWVAAGKSTIDLFDGRFTVLVQSEGSGWGAVCAELADKGFPIAAETLDEQAWGRGPFAGCGLDTGGCLLVRPDGYVAWSTAAGAEAGAEELRNAVAAAAGRIVVAAHG